MEGKSVKKNIKIVVENENHKKESKKRLHPGGGRRLGVCLRGAWSVLEVCLGGAWSVLEVSTGRIEPTPPGSHIHTI